MIVAPSILAADFTNLKQDIKRTSDAKVKYLHIDIMDGHFVPNISFGPSIVKQIKPLSNAIFDVHLMISNPEQYINNFVLSGADSITYHYEVNTDHYKMIELIHNHNVKCGISIKPNTSVDVLIPYLDKIDMVLVMSVEPGFGGQKFMENSLEKIKWLDEYRKNNNLNYLIEVDGGINLDTAKLVNKAGVDIIVAGTYLFNANDFTNKVKELESL